MSSRSQTSLLRLTIASFAFAVGCSSASTDPKDEEDESEESAEQDDADDDGDDTPDASRGRDAGAGRDAAAGGGMERDASAAMDAAADASVSNRGDAASSPRDGAIAVSDASSQADASSPPVDAGPPSSCPTALVGWATVSGDGVNGTTGGSGAPVRPKTAEELQMYASDPTPRVIEIAGTFALPRLDIASNKTLLGIGRDATIRGGLRIRGKEDAPISNVVIKNLRVDGATTQVDNDAVQLYFAHHIWIDHCEIWDGPDGNLDMTHAVNWVTVSWTKIRYTENYKKPSGESMDHRYASLVGHSDNNAEEDTGRLKVSFHHNWWAERVIERMPRVRFGEVHVFNNLFASPENNYCVRAGRGAHLLIEGNYFDAVNSPHEFNNAEDEATAHITERDNVYQNTTGNRATGGGGTPFTRAPYSFTLDPAESIPALVRGCAGPR